MSPSCVAAVRDDLNQELASLGGEDGVDDLHPELAQVRKGWLCVCSDESVGAVEGNSFVAETYDLGIPTTTDKNDILRGHRGSA